jgi:hypothetical protein
VFQSGLSEWISTSAVSGMSSLGVAAQRGAVSLTAVFVKQDQAEEAREHILLHREFLRFH